MTVGIIDDMRATVDFEAVWDRICACAGQDFRQVRGKVFQYAVVGGAVVPTTTNRHLPKAQFAKAVERFPVSGPGALSDLQGPSYLYAILTDSRVR